MSQPIIHTEDSLMAMERKDLLEIAKQFQITTYPSIPTIKLVQNILDAQADALDDPEEGEQTDNAEEQFDPLSLLSEQSEAKEEVQAEAEKAQIQTQQVDLGGMDDDDGGFDAAVEKQQNATINLDAKQLLDALTAVVGNSKNTSQAVRPHKEMDTEEGRKAYKEARDKASRMVLVVVHKNNPRMRGERFVTFDVGNAVHSVNWTIRLGKPWYVPESLVPFLRERKYQRLDIVDESNMVPRELGSGNAETKANFELGMDAEFTVSVLKETGKNAAQLLDELHAQRKAGIMRTQEDQFGGLKL